jgi:shikimate-5-dehydrogenase/3-dehydroquinate dehydratase type I
MIPRLFLSASLLACSAFGFLGHHHHQQQQPGWTNNSHERLASLQATTSSKDDAGSCVQRNMFHNYDKPIVLVGCSGEGKEIRRLAQSFLADHQHQGDDGMIPLSSDSSVSVVDKDELIQMIDSKEYSWPNIVVVDFNDPSFSLEEGKHATTLEGQYANILKSLYQDSGLLSIYVNVDPNEGNMDIKASERKYRLEEDVFVQYSDYEICVKNEGTLKTNHKDWEHVEWELSRTIARARLAPAVPGQKVPTANTAHLTMGENTFFLSLSFPEISHVEPYVEQMCEDVDAMEYRTDLLDCQDSRFDLIYGMQLLRRYCRPFVVRVPALPFGGQVLEDVMPIVYTVRTQHQAGTYPDDEAGIAKMFDLLEWGLRAGSEVLDVESAWDKDKTDKLLSYAEQRYSSQILGSHHVVGEEATTAQAIELFQQCALEGRAHGAKVVLSIEDEGKDRMAHEAALIAAALAEKEGKPVIPNVSLILGDVGSFSRVINLPFTPVTHESLPFKAAPGQMSSNEIMATRIITKIVRARKYAILGHNIAYSVSPQMQGTAFAAARLPHQYGRADVETVEEFVESDFFKSDDFGGCSVTIPHKQAIIPYVDVLSEAAKEIGSVNTLIAEQEYTHNDDFERVIYGDNTDWRGIFNPLERKLGGPVDGATDVALILGGGGTARAAAYAASKLGLKRVYYNRTPSKAQDLADSFGGTVIASLDNESGGDDDDAAMSLGDILSSGNSIKVVISTLPAGVEFVLPEWMLADDSKKPIIFDVNYKPYYTKLLRQAEEANCQVVRGSEMLWEQGVGQFEAWTKRTAPYAVMKAIVLQNCLPQVEDPDSLQ